MPCFSDDCQESFPLDKVCRTCLTVLNPVNNIFETTLGSGDPVYRVLNDVCGLKISTEDRTPPNICISCLWKVKDFFAFKNNALYADLLLQEIVGDVECAPIIKEEQPSSIPFNEVSKALSTECAVDDESLAPQPWEPKDNISNSSVGDLPEQECRYSDAENEGIPVTKIRNYGLGYSPAENECGPKSSCDDGALFKCHHCGANKNRKKEMMQHIYSQHFEQWDYQQSSYEEEVEDISQTTLKSAIESEVDLSVTYLANSQNKRKCTKVRRAKSVKEMITFSSKERSDHLKQAEEKRFKCVYCDFRTKWRYSLKVHLLTHTGEKPFKCPHCDYRCGQKISLQFHLRTHTGEKPYVCPHCDHRCSQKKNMQLHLRTHTGEKPFKCTHCKYRCSRKDKMQLHLQIHTGEKPFKCSHCDFRCSRKDYMQLHLRTHTGEKPFKCSHCDYRSIHKQAVVSHIRTHTGEKPFKCPHCDHRCSQKVYLKSHLLTHTGERPFKCPHCNYRCSQKVNLKSHLRTHTGEKPFKCPHCDFRCQWKNVLKTHILKH